jgi:Mesyanzhinovviridae DNA helicase
VSEQEQRQRVIAALGDLDAHSIENRVGVGTPDVNYVHGWIELKCLPKWPARASTPVRLHHDLTQEQRIWLRRRWEAGGEAYVLLQAEHDWLLFDGPTAARVIGNSTQGDLRLAAVAIFHRRELEEDLSTCLSRRAHSRRASGSSSPAAAAG